MLLSPLTIFKESWQITRTNYKSFLKVILWLLPPTLGLVFLNLINQKTGFQFLNYSVPTSLFLTALSFIIGLWVQIVLIKLIGSSLSQEAVDPKKLYRDSWRDTAPFLWINILASLLVFVGFLLFLVPGFIFIFWYFFAPYAFVLDNKRGYAALQKSKELVQGRFWAVVWRIFLPNLIYGAIAAILILIPSLPLGIATHFSTFVRFYNTTPWWFDAWQTLVMLFTLPLTIGFGVILYHNLKEK
ncbi:MAG: hypothetical protein HY982_00550 [Candidatus Magasanikbacteria bacterium]|nr:hypothetical protein [Candidatus Magasanikbacteria bacterium]